MSVMVRDNQFSPSTNHEDHTNSFKGFPTFCILYLDWCR